MIARVMADSLRGKFLVAGDHLRDPNFFKSVVLVIEHARDGAMGIVVNRPSSLSVANALAGHLEVDDDDMVLVGGPVEPADLFLLHRNPQVAQQFDGPPEILPDLFITNTAEQFEAILLGENPSASRVFSGYAGWGPTQLEQELARGDWLIANGSAEHIFKTCPYELWDDLRASVQKSHRLFPIEAPHPERN